MSNAIDRRPRFGGTLRLADLTAPPTAEPSPSSAPAPVAGVEIKTEAERLTLNLVLVRQHLPDIFDNQHWPPLPENPQNRLIVLGISRTDAQALLKWWAIRPGYRKARARRRRIAQELDNDRVARRVAGLALLKELAPDLFDYAAPVPLAIGIDKQIIELGMDRETVGDVLAWWTRTPGYRAAVAGGGPRMSLDGSAFVTAYLTAL